MVGAIPYCEVFYELGDCVIEIAVLSALVVIVISLLLIARRSGAKRKHNLHENGNQAAKSRENRTLKNSACPLCGSTLSHGQSVHSVVYSDKADTIAEVYGCPYCYRKNAKIKRSCPICGVVLPADEFLIGRMLRDRKPSHLHVLGCTICRKIPSSYKFKTPD